MQPHVRRFVERAITFQTLPRVRRHPADARRRGPRRSAARTSPTCARCRSATWPTGCATSTSPSVAPLLAGLQHLLDSFDEIGLGYLSPRPPRRHAVRGRGPAHQDDPPPRVLAHRRHLRLRRADDRAAPARHRADERPAAAAARQGQHRAGRGAQAGDDRDRRPRRRPRARVPAPPAARSASRAPSTGCGGATPPPVATSTTGPASRSPCATSVGRPRGRGARRTHNLQDVDVDIPLGMLCVITGVAGLGQELADPRLGRRPRRRGGGRPGRDQGFAPQQPRDVHRAARADPQGVRQGQRRQAGAVQLQLRGRVLRPATAPASSTPSSA